MMWRIYYSDDSTYEGVPESAPKRGVQAILQPNNNKPGYHVLQQGDYYLWREDWDGMWQAADAIGRLFYELDSGWKLVLFGETIPNSMYAEITQRALDEAKRLNK